VADETQSTETSAATTDQTAETTAETTAEISTETTEAADDLGTTALGGKADEAKEGETEGTTVEVPEAYDLTAPEGFTLDPEAVAAATPVFKELGLSNEQADKLMPVAADFAKRIVDQRDQQIIGTIAEQRKSWLEEAKADKEIGGQNWDASLGTAAKALDQLGFPKGSPFRNILDESGLGNNPEMIRAFARVGKAIGEDTDLVRGSQNASVKPTDEELFYGGQKG
jgi:hypothetical protein